ncbi:MAG TPA: EamA family transporter [Chloroflexota bacterium]|nr:EamA family transporter [Chloroflexota bacterium]
MNPTALILTSVFLGVAGQLLLKSGATQIGPVIAESGGLPRFVRSVLTSSRIWGGLSFYGVSTLFWLAALSRVELGYAYPFLSLSYAMICFTSWILFGERLTTMRLFGVAVICVGVYVVAGGWP